MGLDFFIHQTDKRAFDRTVSNETHFWRWLLYFELIEILPNNNIIMLNILQNNAL